MSSSVPHTPWPRVAGLAALLAAVIGVLVVSFSWTAVASEAQNLPVALVAPDAVADQLEEAIDERAPGVLEVRAAADRDEAVRLIETREVYGAIVVGESPEILVTSAGSPVTAQLLQGLAAPLQAQLQQAADARAAAVGAPTPTVTVAVTDVVPLVDADPRGAGLAAAAFPLVLGGMAGGIAISLAIVGLWRRIGALVVYSLAAGFATTGVLQGWFGVLPGDYLLGSLAYALAFAAVGAPMVGLAALVGRAGLAIGPVVFMLFANPLSGATQPIQFLPEPWGAVGQWFPPGASATLVRDIAYFPSADTVFPWLVLAGWAGAGMLLALLGRVRQRATSARRSS